MVLNSPVIQSGYEYPSVYRKENHPRQQIAISGQAGPSLKLTRMPGVDRSFES